MYNERVSRRGCLERITGEPPLRQLAVATLGPVHVDTYRFCRTPTYALEALIRDFDASPKNASCESVAVDVSQFLEP